MFKGQLMVRPGRVTLIVHDPIDTSGVPRESAREFASNVHDVVASRVA
jgi:hypothetical protein